MPLLPAEPYCFPQTLLTEPDPQNGERWWVLHTRPRTEKALARALHSHQVAYFLPLYERIWRSGGRLQKSHLPLFTGYVFLRADDNGRITALTTNYIANCLPVADQARLRGELEQVYRLMTADVPIGPEAKLLPGMPVVIARGPLAGLTGKVLRRGKKYALVVEVQMLRQGVSVEIESWMVEPMVLHHAYVDQSA
jgi:transcription antitermination factor NusG